MRPSSFFLWQESGNANPVLLPFSLSAATAFVLNQEQTTLKSLRSYTNSSTASSSCSSCSSFSGIDPSLFCLYGFYYSASTRWEKIKSSARSRFICRIVCVGRGGVGSGVEWWMEVKKGLTALLLIVIYREQGKQAVQYRWKGRSPIDDAAAANFSLFFFFSFRFRMRLLNIFKINKNKKKKEEDWRRRPLTFLTADNFLKCVDRVLLLVHIPDRKG